MNAMPYGMQQMGYNGMGMGQMAMGQQGGMGGYGSQGYGPSRGGGFQQNGGMQQAGGMGGGGMGMGSGGTGQRRMDADQIEGKLFLGGLDNATSKQSLLDYVTQWCAACLCVRPRRPSSVWLFHSWSNESPAPAQGRGVRLRADGGARLRLRDLRRSSARPGLLGGGESLQSGSVWEWPHSILWPHSVCCCSNESTSSMASVLRPRQLCPRIARARQASRRRCLWAAR